VQVNGEDAPDPLNIVRVVGVSPIKQPSRAEWAGVGGDAVIIAPVEEFGANEVAPIAYLQAQYSVTTTGDEEALKLVHLDPVERTRSGAYAETPEQAFARQARAAELEARSKTTTKSSK
jgi:hypothetical protein